LKLVNVKGEGIIDFEARELSDPDKKKNMSYRFQKIFGSKARLDETLRFIYVDSIPYNFLVNVWFDSTISQTLKLTSFLNEFSKEISDGYITYTFGNTMFNDIFNLTIICDSELIRFYPNH